MYEVYKDKTERVEYINYYYYGKEKKLKTKVNLRLNENIFIKEGYSDEGKLEYKEIYDNDGNLLEKKNYK